MQLRPRQAVAKERCLSKLKEHGNTVLSAIVGFGKTIMLASVMGEYERGLLLQHRVELLDQNMGKFKRVNVGGRTAIFAANHKRWCPNGHTFAMAQTLKGHLHRMQPVDILAIDECHHTPAKSYQDIIERAKELNPNVHLFGVSATLEREDKKGLKPAFTNVADVVTLAEMVATGLLVRPRTFIIEMGIADQLNSIKTTKNDYDMDAAARLMDIEPVTERVVSEWLDKARGRRTIGFATNVEHSKHMTAAFVSAGVRAEHLDGTTPPGERKRILHRLFTGETEMVWNCAVLTEGFDEPSVSCVILNRPAMFKGTMIQMVGRGLRTISEPEKYPGLIKDDCIILDFGASLLKHGGLESDYDIEGEERKPGNGPIKVCPECATEIPMGCRTCPICANTFGSGESTERTVIENFVMTEIDLMNLSPFRWEELWPPVVVANGLTAWAACVQYQGIWFAYGGMQGESAVKLLCKSHDKLKALASSDDFLREHGDTKQAKKSKSWIGEPASDKQMQMLGRDPGLFRPNRYRAACELTWKFAEFQIHKSILVNSPSLI